MAAKTYYKSSEGGNSVGPHFKVREFACNDGTDQILIDPALVSILEGIRSACGNKPVNVNSGYRTPAYNKKIGGATESYHMKGMAADISIAGVKPADVAAVAERALNTAGIPGGIGLYATFTHVDVRPSKWRGDQVRGVSVASFLPTLRKGSTGDDVKRVQAALKLPQTGVFDEATEAAVREFQRSRGLTVDGIVGAKTWAALGI